MCRLNFLLDGIVLLLLNLSVFGYRPTVMTQYNNAQGTDFDSESLFAGEVPLDLAKGRSARLGSLWTRNDGFGIIFIMSKHFKPEEETAIGAAAHELRKHSCIPINLVRQAVFVAEKSKNERLYRNHVFITRFEKEGCYGDVGMDGQRQFLNLDPHEFCTTTKGEIMHEMMHSLGLHHEQSRPDRDKYIRINYDNVEDEFKGNFKLRTGSTPIGPYDYKSIMHYPNDAYSKNGKQTIQSLDPKFKVPKNKPLKLSRCDISKIKYITGCTSTFQKCD